MRLLNTYCLLPLCLLSHLLAGSIWTPNVAAAVQSSGDSDRTQATAIASPGRVIPAGEQITLHSKILSEDRNVFVALPASYAYSNERYPVLYLTDAQYFFDQTRSTVAFLARERIVPELIVVGVTSPDRTHDLYATRADFKFNGRTIPFPNSGNADKFLEFIAKELIPWTEKAYRTSDLRGLAGVSAGGYFALHSARIEPRLFQFVIAASPWLAWDDSKELKELLPFIASSRFQVRTLFLSYAAEGSEGPEMKANVETLVAALQDRNDSSLDWALRSYPEETHNTTVLKAYYDGLRMAFAGWNGPRDPKTNLLVGSLEDLKAYYAKEGDRLGIRLAPPERVVNELGYQYLRTGSSDMAVTAFRFNVEQYPESANAWDSLGEGLERLGKRDEALASYRKAVALGEKNHVPNIEHLRQNLLRLTKSSAM